MRYQSENNWRLTLLAIAIALGVMIVLGVVIWRFYRGDDSLLRNASFASEQISPNADGDTDLVQLGYEVSRNAFVSIYFEDQDGQRYYFRNTRLRGAGEYQVLFSGVVDGFSLPEDQLDGEIIARLLPDGQYMWTIEATDLQGVTESQTGPLTIVDSDPELPELRDFSLDKRLFTPNRDGINDRILIQYQLMKEANVRVFLQLPEGGELSIGELERDIPAGMPGRHYYDYEGGVDNGETPPPDGEYPVVAIAEDVEGQKVRVSSSLTIQDGGVPRADVFAPPAGDTFEVSGTAVALCDTLFFTVTVQNYGNTIIRTTGPEPGTVYDSDWNYNTLGWHTESGAWRLAVGYENELANYPYRWAVGSPEDLVEQDGFTYLPPGERALVTGGIRLVGPFGERNPQPVWIGLIHEDVEITEFNNRVDPKQILVDLPDEDNLTACEPREIPVKTTN
ncbi:MAG: hypothetical protein QNJ45_24345 [Ardenticatenaceae bacterium]|nr:hypothetical protein [Ardenticatenaceae bacterium]